MTDLAVRAECLAFTLAGFSKSLGLPQVKLGWIYDAEEKLGIVKVEGAKYGVIPCSARMPGTLEWRGLSLPRLLSTSGLILLFYVLFIVFDAAFLYQLL